MTNKKIDAQLVKNLREKTGASIIECRNALLRADGDLEKAADILRKSGWEKASKKSDRETGEGVVVCYTHSNKKIGSMVEVFCETDFVAKNSEFQDLAHDIALHVAAMSPRYLSFESVGENEKIEYAESVRDRLKEEKKPKDIVEKIVTGKVKKHFEEISLLSQPFVKNPDMTVDDLIKGAVSKIGENIRVGRFERFEI